MICPRCSVAEISPVTQACELCGYVPDGPVAVDAAPTSPPSPAALADATDAIARRDLAHEFHFDVLLGQGSASTVYLARDKSSDQLIVLKVLPRLAGGRADADERFRDALAVATSLDHPHLVPILRYGMTDSLFWYSMVQVRARPLRETLGARGPFDLKSCLRLVTQLAAALDYAHRRGVVHGAVKPENVLLDTEGWAYLSDPMVARALEPPRVGPAGPTPAPPAPPLSPAQPRATPPATASPRATPDATARPRATPPDARRPTPPEVFLPRTTPPAGSAGAAPATPSPPKRPDHVPPEDFQGGQRSPSGDQYALASLVFECLTGTPPGETSEALHTHRPDLPAHVSRSVTRARSPRPLERFPSVLDFVTALETGSAPLGDPRPSGQATPVVLSVPGWTPPPREVPWRLILGTAAVLLAGVLWFAAPRLMRLLQGNEWEQLPASSVIQQAPRARDSAATPAVDTVARVEPPPSRSRTAARRQDAGEAQPRPSRDPTAVAPTATDVPAPAAATPAPSPPAPAQAPAPAATEAGRLSVNATPWGELYVDGRLIGNTPKANLPLAPGAHTIRIVRDGFEPYERTILVAPGETVRLTGIQLTERRP